MNKDYLKAEEFIWRDILQQVEGAALPRIRNMWKKEQHVPRMLFSWPSEHLKTSDGKREITHLVTFVPEKDVSTFDAAVLLAKSTKAYALLLIERQGNTVKAILESPHGARSWNYPVSRHGDVEVLGKVNATRDDECIGILWRRNMTLN